MPQSQTILYARAVWDLFAAPLSKMAKVLNLPSVVTASYPQGPNGPVMSEISDILADATLVNRQGEINAWEPPEFRAAIEKSGRKKSSWQVL